MKSLGQFLRPFFANAFFAVFHLADVMLRNAGQCGKLFLGRVFTGTVCPQRCL